MGAYVAIDAEDNVAGSYSYRTISTMRALYKETIILHRIVSNKEQIWPNMVIGLVFGKPALAIIVLPSHPHKGRLLTSYVINALAKQGQNETAIITAAIGVIKNNGTY